MIQQWNIQVTIRSKRASKRDRKTQRESERRRRKKSRRWSAREVDGTDKVDEIGRECMVWESGRERFKVWEEKGGCYLEWVAVWGLPFLQRCHLVLITSCSTWRGGTCAKAMGAKVFTWRNTDRRIKQSRVTTYWRKKNMWDKWQLWSTTWSKEINRQSPVWQVWLFFWLTPNTVLC